MTTETPPELRRDPVSGRWVVIAPARAQRPGTIRPDTPEREDDLAGCPFCAGRESATPPETFALGPPGRPADAPGWWVRVVPNKFPAFGPWSDEGDRDGLFARRAALGRQEVVVHSPRHVRTFAELAGRELDLVAEAWQNRAAAAQESGFGYMQAILNEGREAGASLSHSHSQLVWLKDEPPLVGEEARVQEEAGGCVLCRVLAGELEQRIRVVVERDGLVLLCPFAGRQPYELLVTPRDCEEEPFSSPRLAPALRLLAEGIRRLRVAEGDVPVNAWVHPRGHWHIEVLPRLSVLAGLELGAGYFLNTLAPESAAGVLREA
ncbi:MAG: galactose-1-phosphate uridylyltransferase [Gaiellaceae bacterium]